MQKQQKTRNERKKKREREREEEEEEEMEIELLGFANRRPKKRFATSVSRKDEEKLTDLKGGSN